MNEKQGDLLDQRIRQALGGLPDAPPLGSPFDSARLWEQLRTELSAPPVSRKRIGGWWWAAASVVGLVMGVWWLGQDNAFESKKLSDNAPNPLKGALVEGKEAWQRPTAFRGLGALSDSLGGNFDTFTYSRSAKPLQRNGPAPAYRSHGGAALGRKAKNAVPNWPDDPTEHRRATGTPVRDRYVVQPPPPQPVTPESLSLIHNSANSIPVVAITPKRRFRVVHENELMAEDEAHRVRYAPEGRTERFVRIGNGHPSQPTANDDLPALQLPLIRKTPQ